MFNFGMGYGMWLGIIAALKMPYTLVTPQRWKKEIMDGISDKEASSLKACQLFPQVADQLSKKSNNGKAEALLLAEWGKRSFNKQWLL